MLTKLETFHVGNDDLAQLELMSEKQVNRIFIAMIFSKNYIPFCLNNVC